MVHLSTLSIKVANFFNKLIGKFSLELIDVVGHGSPKIFFEFSNELVILQLGLDHEICAC